MIDNDLISGDLIINPKESFIVYVKCTHCSGPTIRFDDNHYCPSCVIAGLRDELLDLEEQLSSAEDLLAKSSDHEMSLKLNIFNEKVDIIKKMEYSDLRSWIDLFDSLPDIIDDLVLVSDDEYLDEVTDG